MAIPGLNSGAIGPIRPGDGFTRHAFWCAAIAGRGRRNKMDKHNSQNGTACEGGHRDLVHFRRILFYGSFTEILLVG